MHSIDLFNQCIHTEQQRMQSNCPPLQHIDDAVGWSWQVGTCNVRLKCSSLGSEAVTCSVLVAFIEGIPVPGLDVCTSETLKPQARIGYTLALLHE